MYRQKCRGEGLRQQWILSFGVGLAVSLTGCATMRWDGEPGKSLGCGKASLGTGEFSRSFESVQRSYKVVIPSAYDGSPLPLVLSLHGWQENGTSDEQRSGLSKLAEEERFIVVYPDGMDDNQNEGGPWGSWNAAGSGADVSPVGVQPCRNGSTAATLCYNSCACHLQVGSKAPWQCSWTSCVDDIRGFLPALLASVQMQLCIDTRRIYATGFSNGGMATYSLGATLENMLAAIVVVSGGFERGFETPPASQVPVMHLHGNRDETIPWNGTVSADGVYFTPTAVTLDLWSQRNGCTEPGSFQWRTSQDSVAGLACIAWAKCDAPIVRCLWSGGHDYYAGDHARLVWEFLSRFQREL